MVGEVNYYNDYSGKAEYVISDNKPINTLELILAKRKSFAHEQEIRLIMSFPAEPQFKAMTENLNPRLGDAFVMPPVEITPSYTYHLTS